MGETRSPAEPNGVGERDERGGPAAGRVEDADQLRHRGHLHTPGPEQSKARAERRTGNEYEQSGGGDNPVTDHLSDSGRDRRRHSGGRELVTPPRRRRGVHQVQAEDEACRGGQEQQMDRGSRTTHDSSPLVAIDVDAGATGRFRNISSIRSVTT